MRVEITQKTIPVYCKCKQCDQFFLIGNGKRRSNYCTKQCNDKAYYNKKLQ